jgi:DNA-binding winged helix-turn-helix (wHTH) protein
MQAPRVPHAAARTAYRTPETVDSHPAPHGVEPRGRPTQYRFGEFVLSPALFELRRAGKALPVAPKVFDLILYLIENRGRVVTHADFRAHLWRGVTVTESSLTYTVMAARRVLGDEGRSQRFIRNVRCRGYCFVPALSIAESDRGSTWT